MTSINVHGNVGQVKRLERICDALLVTICRVLASSLVNVGDQVGERIGLDDESNGGVGVLLEDGDDGCGIWLVTVGVLFGLRLTINIFALVDAELADSKFTVGGLGGAITTGQVVDDESGDLVTADVLEVVLDNGDTGTGIAMWRSASVHYIIGEKLTSKGKFRPQQP